MTPQQDFLLAMRDAAKAAGHAFPEYAACEAANLTNYGASDTLAKAKNVFGVRARASWRNANMLPKGIGIIALPIGTQIVNGRQITQMGDYARFTDATAAFKYRMDTLNSLPTTYYAALKATTGEQFILQVAAQWNKLDVNSAPEDTQNVYEFSDGWYQFVKSRWYADPATASAVMKIYADNVSIINPAVVEAPAPVASKDITPAPAETTE